MTETKTGFRETDPRRIFEEYEQGIRFKNAMGTHGMFEQNKINERFYCGDQWYGARCGNDRPLVRYNVIQRIGKYSGRFTIRARRYCISRSRVSTSRRRARTRRWNSLPRRKTT